jgi:hypothetical protein
LQSNLVTLGIWDPPTFSGLLRRDRRAVVGERVGQPEAVLISVLEAMLKVRGEFLKTRKGANSRVGVNSHHEQFCNVCSRL